MIRALFAGIFGRRCSFHGRYRGDLCIPCNKTRAIDAERRERHTVSGALAGRKGDKARARSLNLGAAVEPQVTLPIV